MASKDTGFHPSDPDWTRGRAQAVADAESIARRQIGLTRRVTLTETPDPVIKPAPDAAAIREALLSLPAVYAHQINTGVREVYDPLQRFYTMESVLAAITEAGQ